MKYLSRRWRLLAASIQTCCHIWLRILVRRGSLSTEWYVSAPTGQSLPRVIGTLQFIKKRKSSYDLLGKKRIRQETQ